jgi:streptogramin lyase
VVSNHRPPPCKGEANVLVRGSRSRSDQRLVRIDLKTRKVVATIRLPGVATSLSAGELGSVWVGLGLANWIVQIDPQTNGIFKKVELGGCCSGPSVVAVDGSTIWVTNAIGTRRVQPGTQSVPATIPGTGTAGAIVDKSHHLWVSNGWDTVSVIEPFTGTLSYTLRCLGGRPDSPVALVPTSGSPPRQERCRG